jgi:hypothetical protein
MTAWWTYPIVLGLLACRSVLADSITMTDNVSINGSVSGMSDGVVRITARFPSGAREGRFPIKEIQSIEFNSKTFNAGPPPKIMGFGPPRDQNASQSGHPADDVVVLRGGSRRACNLVSIDADRVHCGPNDPGIRRDTVLRIVLGSK